MILDLVLSMVFWNHSFTIDNVEQVIDKPNFIFKIPFCGQNVAVLDCQVIFSS